MAPTYSAPVTLTIGGASFEGGSVTMEEDAPAVPADVRARAHARLFGSKRELLTAPERRAWRRQKRRGAR